MTIEFQDLNFLGTSFLICGLPLSGLWASQEITAKALDILIPQMLDPGLITEESSRPRSQPLSLVFPTMPSFLQKTQRECGTQNSSMKNGAEIEV
jgi:hypothetical protein